jgi:hypothetical protein
VAPHRPYVKCSNCGNTCATKSGLCADCRPSADKKRFLEAYASLGAVGNASALCKLSCATIYRWLEKDKAFLERYQLVQRLMRDNLAGLLYRHANGEGELVTEVFRENGHAATREVQREIKPGQLKAILTFLHATEHLAHRNDLVVLDEKRRADFLEPPPKQIQWIEIHDAQPRVD